MSRIIAPNKRLLAQEQFMKTIRKTLVLTIAIGVLIISACSTPLALTNPAPIATQPAPATQPTVVETQAIEPTSPPASTQLPSAPTSSEMILLKDALPNLQPQGVFQNFYAITHIPRPSGYMDQIRPFLVNFGEGLGLETVVDSAGNVIIRKPASPGMEERPMVILQAHMDMVAQPADGSFDFYTEPIQAYVSGDYIVADGTTLGADDGIGIAMIMAILQSKTLQAPPLEAIFTVDEETTMSGATGLTSDELQGRTYINLDSETEGVFTIGSAGGEHINITTTYTQLPAPENMLAYEVSVSGLQGGHSGVDIDKGLGHATKLLVRLLKGAMPTHNLRISSLAGGTADNAIPTDAAALVFLPASQVDAFTRYVQDYEVTIQTELAATEPDLAVTLQAVDPPSQVMDETFQNSIINAVYGTPQGVLRMSDTVPGLVETSTNLGITSAQDGQMTITCFPRSSVNSEISDAAQMIASVWELAGYSAEIGNYFSSWTPNPDSPILALMQSTYQDLFGHDPQVGAVHAGLECGVISGIYPDMDMISIGPTLARVHTVDENLYIPSVQKVMDLVTTTLQSISK
jgi:dipeptidase D